MTKLLTVLLIGAMLLHLIRPIGLPGLKYRRDFWKLALVAMIAMALSIAARELTL